MDEVAVQLPFWATRGKRTSVDLPVTNQFQGEMASEEQENEDEQVTGSKREKRSLLTVQEESNGAKTSSNGGQRIRNRAVRPDPLMMLNSFWASRGKKCKDIFWDNYFLNYYYTICKPFYKGAE